MKWFKHLSTARNDEKIARLEDKCGLEGYGFYFKMLEIVAEYVDQSNRCEVTFSMSRWGRKTNISTKKFLHLVRCCSDVGLMLVQRASDDITVNIPNLLNYRDNHTKNLQATYKQDKYKEETDIKEVLRTPFTSCPEQKSSEQQTPEMESEKFSGNDGIATVKTHSLVIVELPTNKTGEFYAVTQSDVCEWESLYPAVDVGQQLRNMLGWLKSNPKRRKTKSGLSRFVNSWLAKEQNDGHKKSQNAPPGKVNGSDLFSKNNEYSGEDYDTQEENNETHSPTGRKLCLMELEEQAGRRLEARLRREQLERERTVN
jgi:hypothetical protein